MKLLILMVVILMGSYGMGHAGVKETTEAYFKATHALLSHDILSPAYKIKLAKLNTEDWPNDLAVFFLDLKIASIQAATASHIRGLHEARAGPLDLLPSPISVMPTEEAFKFEFKQFINALKRYGISEAWLDKCIHTYGLEKLMSPSLRELLLPGKE